MHVFTTEDDRVARTIVEYCLERLASDAPLDRPLTPAELEAHTGQTVLPEGMGGEAALKLWAEVLGPACLSVDHPRYLSFIPNAPTKASCYFDMLVAASNVYSGSWLEGSGAVHAENQALRWVADLAGLPASAGGTFEGWLHRITTNLFLDMVRRRQRIRFDALPDDAGDRLASREAGPEQAYEQMNLDPEIQQALDELPADFRVAVVLCDLEQLSYEEIAATLGIKLGTVRSRIHRGRVQLRQALAHLAPRQVGLG